MDLFSWYYFWSWCNFLHNIFHQIWWFHKIFTQYGEYLLLFFGTSKITKNFEEKITKYGEKYFRKKKFSKKLWKYSHHIYHQIWWFSEIFTKFCEISPQFFVTFKFTTIVEEKITKYGENYFTKNVFKKFGGDFLTTFITKFSDSLKFSQDLV